MGDRANFEIKICSRGVVECPSFDTRHRKDKGLFAKVGLIDPESGKVEGCKTGIEMEVQLFDLSRLAITQTRQLLGIAGDKFYLKPELVNLVDRIGQLTQVRWEQPNIAWLVEFAAVFEVREANFALK